MVVVSGFLGSGKTTFILQLAKEAVRRGQRVAILVNEIGEIGVDDRLMRRLGYNDWELLGGCVCCSLVTGLTETLEKLEAEYAPDLVLTEPTGAADPRNLMAVLDHYGRTFLKERFHIALLDPLRLTMLMEVITPLMISTMERADLICINKADAATDEEMNYARKVARETKPDGKVVEVSAKRGLEHAFMEDILACLT
jgi:G3E family GTPase